MTHRVFSRNASSSRAIPVLRLIEDVLADPVDPPSWYLNKAGMQGTELMPTDIAEKARLAWGRGRQCAVDVAYELHHLGAHKQHVNRVLEPYAHINVLCTSTEWTNFFGLRAHPDAQPEIQELARVMYASLKDSTPEIITDNDWHLPYITEDDFKADHDLCDLLKMSVARCARVSYMTHDMRVPDKAKDIDLYHSLVGSNPKHASPAEHQARPDPKSYRAHQWGNFCYWEQYRKTLPNENIEEFNL